MTYNVFSGMLNPTHFTLPHPYELREIGGQIFWGGCAPGLGAK